MKNLGTKANGEDIANQEDLGGGGTAKAYAWFTNAAVNNLTGMSGTELTLNLDTEHEDSGNLFSVAAGVVTATIGASAKFKLLAGAYLNNSSSSRSEWSSWIYKNGVKIEESRHVTYQRGYESGQSAMIAIFVDVANGDTFEIKAGRTDGSASTGIQEPYGTFMMFEEK